MRPKVPSVKGTARTDVDRFILAALEAKQLALSPEADRPTLVRRVCFDLTGLPPTVPEIEQFLADKSPDAYEKMLDRYLASPRHYGERWGKVWLDAAGYADSNGYFNADSDRPLAWKYRDYVIASVNADKPYDAFVREQLAGDEARGLPRPGGDVTPAMVEGAHRHAFPAERTRRHGRERRQPGRSPHRPIHGPGRQRPERHELSARRDGTVRPLPRSQV